MKTYGFLPVRRVVNVHFPESIASQFLHFFYKSKAALGGWLSNNISSTSSFDSSANLLLSVAVVNGFLLLAPVVCFCEFLPGFLAS